MEQYWKDKDGNELLISKMTDKHINSCIHLLEIYAAQRSERTPKRLAAALDGSMDPKEQSHLRYKLAQVLKDGISPQDVNPAYNTLCLEQYRRFQNLENN